MSCKQTQHSMFAGECKNCWTWRFSVVGGSLGCVVHDWMADMFRAKGHQSFKTPSWTPCDADVFSDPRHQTVTWPRQIKICRWDNEVNSTPGNNVQRNPEKKFQSLFPLHTVFNGHEMCFRLSCSHQDEPSSPLWSFSCSAIIRTTKPITTKYLQNYLHRCVDPCWSFSELFILCGRSHLCHSHGVTSDMKLGSSSSAGTRRGFHKKL